MINFKPKSSKKIILEKINNVETLDTKHNEFLNKFNKNDNINIPKLKLENQRLKKYNDENIPKLDEYNSNITKIKENNKIIKKMNNEKKDYFLNNSNILFDYFEKKKELSQGNNKKKVINNFFKLNKNEDKVTTEQINQSETEKYFMNINPNFVDINSYIEEIDICEYCNGELVPVENDGILICKKCGSQFNYLIEHEKPSYKEPPKEVCFYAYKRLNHFKEILAQFQAKETTNIPDKVLEDVKKQIKKERIEITDFNHIKAKEILKKLGYNKYYEHISFIKDKLGIKPPNMSLELEEKLINLFLETQKPYAKYCPDDRLNYLNYYYVLYKLCEMLNEIFYLQYCPMLKDPDKIIEQDIIWKKICDDLKWNFKSTII
mgnify:FL=1|jgi:hypothetical protein